MTGQAGGGGPTAGAGDEDGTTRRGWRFWIDRGGTFTDVVAQPPHGGLRTYKLLSEDPDRYEDAAVEGVRRLLGLESDEPIAPELVAEVRMGTTVATNALLERAGAPTLYVTTRGFGDALRIGYQDRPDIFALDIRLPAPAYVRVLEVDERVDADGHVVRPLDEEGARRGLEEARRSGLDAVAIAFVHGYASPDHERRVAELARTAGFSQVSVSHETSPLMKLVGRGETTVVDAYLSPILRHYVDGVAEQLGDVRLRFMQSHGGLTDASLFRGKDAVLSGPAGGVVGAVALSRSMGYDKVIAFDMGGTSTDVSHYAGELERSYESVVGGVRLRSPMLRVHTVAAGGGSVCTFEDGRYRVGPRSAGADPGPACYGRGGPLTVTDCNLIVGKLRPAYFPHVFGPDGAGGLNEEAARRALAAVAASMRAAGVEPPAPEQLADDFIRVACEAMARAIKRISTQRGHDVTDHMLCCFGGAAGQHACLVADALGVTRILLHPLAGVLSAYGMGLADVRALREKTVETPLAQAREPSVTAALDDVERAAVEELALQGIEEGAIRIERRAHIKYEGTDVSLAVPWAAPHDMERDFLDLHHARYGFLMPGRALTLEAVSAEAVGAGATTGEGIPGEPAGDGEPGRPGGTGGRRSAEPVPCETAAVFTGGERHDAPVYLRDDLPPGAIVEGPAVICESTGTTVVEPGWRAEGRAGGELLLRRTSPPARPSADPERVSPLLLEVFNSLFMSIAEQMGATLATTAVSVNIKERLDFSCALFDAEGRLVANAPHLPVHLGSMGASVQAVLDRHRDELRPGDAWLLNSPYAGGTHLPDLTVVTPVFIPEAATGLAGGIETRAAAAGPVFFVASRAHHADVGGITPGSMPPGSRTIHEEGVLIEDFRLVDDGRLREAEVADLLSSAPHPVRDREQNLADLRAQVAANARGAAELERMSREFGLPVVRAYMRHVQDNAAEAVRRVLDRFAGAGTGPRRFAHELDDGDRIVVSVTVDPAGRRATVDFTGTSPQRDDNFNAPEAVATAAVLYVFRTLVDADIPLNAGCLEPIDIVIPPGTMLSPRPPAAVAAGNVETSQAITSALLGALGAAAASQSTMNNLTFGDQRFQYYETICGGAGAGPGWDGQSAVHTHMTNSRLTDPEVLEWRYPVRVEEFRVRAWSGGAGEHRGGDGVVRRVRFLEPLTAAIVSSSRRVPPFGLAGGLPGACGRNAVEGADGSVERLPGVAQTRMAPGDVLVIETPGGGGYGAPPSSP
ncbi:MAG: 5-oxoprolinase [Actinobacteria bacterium]|nr:5-oxoprolinase [Actinomycetota bacterium]